MDSTPQLTPDLIDDPRHWRLAMRLGPAALDVTIYSPIHEGSLIYRRLPLDTAAPSALKALETVVYDNPLLLSDFARISCIVESADAVVLPPGLDDESDSEADDARRAVFEAAVPDFEGETFLSPTGVSGVAVMAGAPHDIVSFLRRSFFNIRLSHNLSPLCRYFLSTASRGNLTRIYVNLRDGAADVVVTCRGELLLANSFDTPTAADAAYYVLALRRAMELPDDTETLLAGSATLRDALSAELRKAGVAAMPVIFPSSMFRAGKDAMRAPFDLIILPLCE